MAGDPLNIVIGGEAGQGLVTIGQLLAKALVRNGTLSTLLRGINPEFGEGTTLLPSGPDLRKFCLPGKRLTC